MLKNNEGRAYFSLVGYSFNPDDITRLLGVEPTSTNNAGAHSGPDRPGISSWELSTKVVSDGLDIYHLSSEIITQLEPIKDKIIQVSENYNLAPRMGVVLRLSTDKDESAPDVGLGSRAIRFLADIGAFIDVDYQIPDRV